MSVPFEIPDWLVDNTSPARPTPPTSIRIASRT